MNTLKAIEAFETRHGPASANEPKWHTNFEMFCLGWIDCENSKKHVLHAMTQSELIAAGCRIKHWNKNSPEGGWFEYWLPIETYPDGRPCSSLSVRFDQDPRYGRDWMVYLVYPQTALALKHITTIEQFRQQHALLTGQG